jgi:hypothetical protein
MRQERQNIYFFKNKQYNEGTAIILIKYETQKWISGYSRILE